MTRIQIQNQIEQEFAAIEQGCFALLYMLRKMRDTADSGDYSDPACPKCGTTLDDARESELCDEIKRLRAPAAAPLGAVEALDLDAIEALYNKGQREFLTMSDTAKLLGSIPVLIARLRAALAPVPADPLKEAARNFILAYNHWMAVDTEGVEEENRRIAVADQKMDVMCELVGVPRHKFDCPPSVPVDPAPQGPAVEVGRVKSESLPPSGFEGTFLQELANGAFEERTEILVSPKNTALPLSQDKSAKRIVHNRLCGLYGSATSIAAQSIVADLQAAGYIHPSPQPCTRCGHLDGETILKGYGGKCPDCGRGWEAPVSAPAAEPLAWAVKKNGVADIWETFPAEKYARAELARSLRDGTLGGSVDEWEVFPIYRGT